MKESSLIEMRKKIDSLTRVTQKVINEITNLRELSVGTLEITKKLPGYTEALALLKKQINQSNKNKKENEKINNNS
ncbi:MAG: hypothetical protein CBD71_04805 [Rickettsiales bacterium TMED211]|nr:MAG: hypothetical protein CBD71_04805 [Rickettsiales bacterium TMED211]|tara:strand:- start:4696 stop:4923 length:228 start_codon:yes stop_codon:yes gene_type:complete